MIELTTTTFTEKFTDGAGKLVNNTDRPAIVDMWAPWCGPCRVIAPTLEKLSTICTEVDFYKLDVDAETQIADMLQIRGIPAIFGLPADFDSSTGLPVMVGVHTEEQIKEFIHDKIKNCQ